jgi:hypothetical protein
MPVKGDYTTLHLDESDRDGRQLGKECRKEWSYGRDHNEVHAVTVTVSV